MLRCDFAELRPDLLRRHVLLAYDAEETDYRSLREAELTPQFCGTRFGLRSCLAAHPNLLREYFGEANLFGRRRAYGDRTVSDGLRRHPARRFHLGLRQCS